MVSQSFSFKLIPFRSFPIVIGSYGGINPSEVGGMLAYDTSLHVVPWHFLGHQQPQSSSFPLAYHDSLLLFIFYHFQVCRMENGNY